MPCRKKKVEGFATEGTEIAKRKTFLATIDSNEHELFLTEPALGFLMI